MSERDEDIEQQAYELMLQESLSKTLVLSKYTRPPNGFCHWCDEIAPEGATHCSKECAEDHDKVLKQKAKGLL